MLTTCEYIWLDGAKPTAKLRSKMRFVDLPADREAQPSDLPEWSYDGSSTFQASGGDSDLILLPVRVVRDPIRPGNSCLVLCEVANPDGTPHASNTRARLREVLDAGAANEDPWFGFEQEYTLMAGGRPLGWPENGGYPAPQGPFYCGVGANEVFGRDIVERHAQACAEADLMFYGINAEVMPGQWEFQIGYRGVEGEPGEPLKVADHLWLGRWLLQRIAEDQGVAVSFENKPMKGDWNGAGNHTNYSTAAMRADGGFAHIESAIEKLSLGHSRHIADYGHGLADRLTGEHETCSIEVFKNGVADRGASIRIPRPVALKGKGYLEDRRPGANSDPYLVAAHICATTCDLVEVMGSRVQEDAMQIA